MALMQKLPVIRKQLEGHVLGENEMTPTQIKAAEILLKKVVPDLKAVEHTGEVTFNAPTGGYFLFAPAGPSEPETAPEGSVGQA
jgi:hypothetical protein